MATIRVPYPRDPGRRQELFEKALAMLGRHGTCRGTTESGSIEAATPIGRFAGTYASPEGSDTLEVEVIHKPFLIPLSLIESEARRFTAAAVQQEREAIES